MAPLFVYVLQDNGERSDTIGFASGIVLRINFIIIEGCMIDDLPCVFGIIAATLDRIVCEYNLGMGGISSTPRPKQSAPAHLLRILSKACSGTIILVAANPTYIRTR